MKIQYKLESISKKILDLSLRGALATRQSLGVLEYEIAAPFGLAMTAVVGYFKMGSNLPIGVTIK